ncbi:MAG: ribosome silencing factor [Tissierellia bacterium]|nr:ribosome silencing factor [Tissierellia bacterium]
MTRLEAVLKACEDKIAKEVVTIPIDEKLAIADYFVIATGNSRNQTQAIADEIEKVMAEMGSEPSGKEGYREGSWILLDFGDIIVHIFTAEDRKYYDLERLWSNNK